MTILNELNLQHTTEESDGGFDYVIIKPEHFDKYLTSDEIKSQTEISQIDDFVFMILSKKSFASWSSHYSEFSSDFDLDEIIENADIPYSEYPEDFKQSIDNFFIDYENQLKNSDDFFKKLPDGTLITAIHY